MSGICGGGGGGGGVSIVQGLQDLVLINRARGLYGRILTEVASTDRTQ